MPAMGRWHHEREQMVRASGIPATILRPSGFMTNALDWLLTIREGDFVLDPLGPGRAAPIDPADIAAVAALVLTEDGHQGAEYALTGDEVLTVTEQVRILAAAIGRDLEVREVATPAEAVRFRYPNGAPQALTDALIEGLTLMRTDTAGFRTDTVKRLLGRRPRTFADWCTRNASAFLAVTSTPAELKDSRRPAPGLGACPGWTRTASRASPAHRVPAAVSQGAERHRPPLLHDRRDVVLPLCPCRAGQDVGGAGLEGEFGRLPGAGPAAAEPHPARGLQRDAGDLAELRRIAVPADPRAGRVARHEQIRQLPRFAPHQRGAALPEPVQLGGDRRGRAGVVGAGDQGEAEASHQPPRWRVVQHVRLQLEPRQQRQHIAFLGLGEEARHVDQTLRQRHRVASPTRHRGADVAGDRGGTVLIPGEIPATAVTHTGVIRSLRTRPPPARTAESPPGPGPGSLS